MRRNHLDLSKYNSDKCDYLKYYDPFFEPLAEKNITLLEIGIFKGGSLLLWDDYFPKGKIVGVDIQLPVEFQPSEKISLFEGSQDDFDFLSSMALQTAPHGFDIIIDDASHFGQLSKRTFWYLFDNHLKLGGIYAIEDWGTGYWNNWPDGESLDLSIQQENGGMVSKEPLPCHSYGMVGFIKQLVDEQGAADVTKFSPSKIRDSKFESMTICPFIVFIKKA